MHYSSIYPYLMYVSILWCSYYYSPIYDVFKLQNKAIREDNDVTIMDNFTPHYTYVNLGILKFPDIVKLHTCLFFFDILNDFGPSNFIIPVLSVDRTLTYISTLFNSCINFTNVHLCNYCTKIFVIVVNT